MRRAASLIAWFAALEVLWAVLVGTRQSTELLVGLAVAAVGAAFAEVLRSQRLLDFRTDWRLLAKGGKLVWLVPLDFVVVTRVLVRSIAQRRRVRGTWVEVPFATPDDATGRWQRAFAAATANGAANAIVVDLDHDRALLHSLDPGVSSGRTVL